MQSKALLDRLRKFDAYPKTLEDFRIKTFGGATSKTSLYKLYQSSDNIFGYIITFRQYLPMHNDSYL